jgi:hypothetical protein
MTNEQIESELKHVATKESLADFRAEMHKDFGNFKAEITKTLWLSQLSMAGIMVALIGLINGASFFFINQTVADVKSDLRDLRAAVSHLSPPK